MVLLMNGNVKHSKVPAKAKTSLINVKMTTLLRFSTLMGKALHNFCLSFTYSHTQTHTLTPQQHGAVAGFSVLVNTDMDR